MNSYKNALAITTLILAVVFLAGPVGHAKEPNQANCPVMGGAVDKNVYTDYQGKRVYFCCSYCIQEFHKDPVKYLNKLDEQNVILETAPDPKKSPQKS